MEAQAALNHQTEARPRVTVSLTTYPARIDRVHIAIESLLLQTRPADRVVLWLAREQFPDGEEALPAALLEQRERGLSIEWCEEDIRSYKKIIPAAEKWPEDIIITADDDLVYECTAVERLLESYSRHPDCVSTLRAHLMRFGEDGSVLPYEQWVPEYSAFVDRPLMALFPTTGGGMLFPPSILPGCAFERDVFTDICPTADDIWIKCMLTLAGVKTVLASPNTRLQHVEGTQNEGLYDVNRTENDTQLAAVLERYGNVGGEENPADTLQARLNDLPGCEPDMSLSRKFEKKISLVNEQTGIKVSVIVLAQGGGSALRRFLHTVSAQTLEQIEIILVNNGGGEETAALLQNAAAQDCRARVITLEENLSPTLARRRAVLTCRGEYCLFPDAGGVLAPDACEQLYACAEENDADIFSFTCGRVGAGGEAVAVHQGHKGLLRNRNLIPKEFGYITTGDDRLSRCIFGGRLTRRAYLHAEAAPAGGTLYDYFLLCRFSEAFVGQETSVFYALPEASGCIPAHEASCLEAMERFVAFGGTAERFAPVLSDLRRRLTEGQLEGWLALSGEERVRFIREFTDAWGVPCAAAAIARCCEQQGEEALRRAALCPLPERTGGGEEKVGVVVSDPSCAREIFAMTDLLDCIAVSCPTVLIGVTREKASSAVISARTVCEGSELWSGEGDGFSFGEEFDRVLERTGVTMLVISTAARRFAQMALHARLRGVTCIGVAERPVYYDMINNCSRQEGGISALRLASAVITHSAAQQRLLDVLGLPVRYVPLPALRLMGGRSSSRAADNVILWTGSADDSCWRMDHALEIFRRVKERMPGARMIMYLDGECDTESLAGTMPEDVTLRRLRPDYGIFSDASVQLVTGRPGLTGAPLRAGRALGVPSVMYRYHSEQESGAGGVTVPQGDTAAAAAELLNLLANKQLREQLGAQGKVAAGVISREEAARRWREVIAEITAQGGRAARLPEDELGRVLDDMLCGYEDGARSCACAIAEMERSSRQRESELTEAQTRLEEKFLRLEQRTAELNEQLRSKERQLAAAGAQLEEIRSSTIYKTGSALTLVPRWLKKRLAGLKKDASEQ